MKAAAYVLLLLAVLALSVPGFAQAPDDDLIVPGQRIGKWTLDMSLDELSRINGPGVTGRPAEQDVRPGFNIRVWPELALIAGLKEGQTQVAWFYVGMIPDLPWTGISLAKTDRGISSTSCKDEVTKAYGRPTWQKVAKPVGRTQVWRLVYDRLGIAFLFIPIMTTYCPSGDGVLLGMSIFRPEAATSIWR